MTTAQSGPQRVDWLKTHINSLTVRRLLSVDAEWVYDRFRLHSAAMGSDGVVVRLDVPAATDRKLSAKRLASAIEELVARDLLTAQPDGWSVVGWLDEQPSAEVWADPVKRERWARAKRLKRNEALCGQIKQRYLNRCGYCGIRVDWAARGKKANHAGTYDHIDPDGDNNISNVCVACRGCNARKADRTPEQAGMRLLTRAELDTIEEREVTARAQSRAEPADQPGLSPGSVTSRAHARSYGPGRAGAGPPRTAAPPTETAPAPDPGGS